jgi:hypothetical protein
MARDTSRLGPTLGVENSRWRRVLLKLCSAAHANLPQTTATFHTPAGHVRFLGNLVLNLWDCGGQDAFMENYFESQRDNIFRNVEVLIYVFDIESDQPQKDVEMFQSCLTAIAQNSKNAHIFVLIHKLDLIHSPDDRARLFGERAAELEKLAVDAGNLNLSCFGTSIWDETLYKAWSSIVYALVPNIGKLETQLTKLCALCQADEVVLFEKATFLVISHATHSVHNDVHRFEKMSNFIKQFKLSCSKTQVSIVASGCVCVCVFICLLFCCCCCFFVLFFFCATSSSSSDCRAQRRSYMCHNANLHARFQSHTLFQSFTPSYTVAIQEHGGEEQELHRLHRQVYVEHVHHDDHV